MALDLSGYMGRGILSGLTSQGEPADVYFAEGRSPPSRMRRLVPCDKHGIVRMDTNSDTTLEKMTTDGGNPALLLYDAMMGDPEGLLVVSNGYQTNFDPDIRAGKCVGVIDTRGIYHRIRMDKFPLHEALSWTLSRAASEPDGLRTARIAVARDYKKTPDITNLGIVICPRDYLGKPGMNDLTMVHRDVKLEKGEFVLFATYGVHTPSLTDPMPPEISTFDRLARRVHLEGTTLEQLADEVFEQLPENLRVGTASAMMDEVTLHQPKGFRFAVKNAKE